MSQLSDIERDRLVEILLDVDQNISKGWFPPDPSHNTGSQKTIDEAMQATGITGDPERIASQLEDCFFCDDCSNWCGIWWGFTPLSSFSGCPVYCRCRKPKKRLREFVELKDKTL
jgi:hypothetical protein